MKSDKDNKDKATISLQTQSGPTYEETVFFCLSLVNLQESRAGSLNRLAMPLPMLLPMPLTK